MVGGHSRAVLEDEPCRLIDDDPRCQNRAEVRDKGLSEIVESHHMHITHTLAIREVDHRHPGGVRHPSFGGTSSRGLQHEPWNHVPCEH